MVRNCKIGFLSTRNHQFVDRLIEIINNESPKAIKHNISAELIKLGDLVAGSALPYPVIIDWASDKMPFYRNSLKQAVISRSYVINNPFFTEIEGNRFFEAGLSHKWNLRSPRTVLLPQYQQDERLHQGDLHNLAYPLDWQHIGEEVGFPALLRSARSGSMVESHLVYDVDDLLYYYHQTGQEAMILQEYLPYERFVRSYTIEKQSVFNIRYLPIQNEYLLDHQHLTGAEGFVIDQTSIEISRLLGLDINMVEYGIYDGTTYLLDMYHPIPNFEPDIITPFYFDELAERIAQMCVDYTLKPPLRRQLPFWMERLFT